MPMVVVEYGPQLVSGSAIFLAFKLGVTDIYSKTLPTIALHKTSSRKATVEGAPAVHALYPSPGIVATDIHRRFADVSKGGTDVPLSWSKTARSNGGTTTVKLGSTSAGSEGASICSAVKLLSFCLVAAMHWMLAPQVYDNIAPVH
jgi:hypothetical protein